MIVVTTPTGQIGRPLVRRLVKGGERVRVIARDAARLDPSVREHVDVVEGSHDDPAVLDKALPGADALFWLVPPNPAAPSTMEHYVSFARAGAAAAARHDVGHLVGVSSAGHGWNRPAGVLSAAFAMDEHLAASGAAYRALALPFYMENLLGQLDAIRRDHAFSLACAGDRPLATIATRDIAEAAAGLLTDLSWTGQADRPLFGPDRLTPEGMAEVIGEELGLPVTYRRITLDQYAAALRARGAGDRTVQDLTEMFTAQDDGIYDADWATATIATTDVRTWCREVLAPVLHATS
jgi:uncharacterized protein YbjT (DUF2867 family)